MFFWLHRETSTTTINNKRASSHQEKSSRKNVLEAERPPKQAKHSVHVNKLSELTMLSASARIGALKPIQMEDDEVPSHDDTRKNYPRLLLVLKEFSDEEKDIIVSG